MPQTTDHRLPKTPETDIWLFKEDELEATPSRYDGYSKEIEYQCTLASTRFIDQCGRKLSIPQVTTCIAVKFYLRFYMLESLKLHRPHHVAAACLFLACKVNETHKRLKEIIYWTKKIYTKNTKDFPDGEEVPENSIEFFREKEQILIKEREILRALNFDLSVDHPYKPLMDLHKTYATEEHGCSQEMGKEIIQSAFNFLNDSIRGYIPLLFDDVEIATAAWYLGCTYCGYTPTDGQQRDSKQNRIRAPYEMFRCDPDRIVKIGQMMLDSYVDNDTKSNHYQRAKQDDQPDNIQE